MPEYRRFIAYFYEYIDGKKQRSAGFAKVELRNGMWRLLFRLTTEILPEPPMKVYGFVREGGYLLGVPMGTIRLGREIAEEWAYQAENPVGTSNYRLEDFSGIWIESGDGRCFLTVWDDEPVQPERFVLELPEAVVEEDREAETVEPEEIRKLEERSEMAAEESEKETVEPEAEVRKPEERSEMAAEESGEEAVEPEAEVRKLEERSEMAAEESGGEAVESEQKSESAVEESGAEVMGQECKEKPGPPVLNETAEQTTCRQDGINELFKIRSRFQPFADTEITDCVMIMPCDIIRLQQENWQVGRSSFLQHGFYQHRHLLLGKTCDGEYVLGVPGIRNPQEQYMAGMFGFEHFKTSKMYGCGKVFGYWCRVLKKAASEAGCVRG
ncbi:MAG: hypothetical protein Q4C61_15440 [Lachnospiraceae bacterium]|nr:hypothetical protein [Lachnospiraceae bacterium]